jgi:hypothetical protein
VLLQSALLAKYFTLRLLTGLAPWNNRWYESDQCYPIENLTFTYARKDLLVSVAIPKINFNLLHPNGKVCIAPIMKNRTLSIIIFAKNNCE